MALGRLMKRMEKRGALQYGDIDERRDSKDIIIYGTRLRPTSILRFSRSQWFYPHCCIALLLLSLCIYPVSCLPQDDAAITSSAEQCDTDKCLESVRDARSCSESDLGCQCDEPDFIQDVFTCIRDELECNWRFATPVTAELESQCTPYMTSAADVCLECYTSQAEKLSCVGPEDYGCVCGAPLTEYEALVSSSCANSFSKGSVTCAEPSVLNHLYNLKSLDCEDHTATAGFDGCLDCEAEAATGVGCAGLNDLDCLCSAQPTPVASANA